FNKYDIDLEQYLTLVSITGKQIPYQKSLISSNIFIVIFLDRSFSLISLSPKKVVNPNREMVASRLVDFPEEVEDETTEPLPEMMFANGEEPVGVRVITYQSSRAIIVVVVSKRRRLELASVLTRSHRSRACPCHHWSQTRPRQAKEEGGGGSKEIRFRVNYVLVN
ncbi:hypothetical protein HID58_060951, partial [Brassica napus]